MDKTYDEVYDEYFTKFRDSSLGDELRYDKDVVATIIDLLKNLKNKLCVSDGNVKSAIDSKFKVINGMNAIKNSSTCTNFDVMNDGNLNTSATKKTIQEMPGNIETLIGDLVKTLEDEKEIYDAYYTRQTTEAHIEKYRKFLSEHKESDYDPVKIKVNYNGTIRSDYNLSEGIDLQYYQDIKKKVEEYDNLTALTNLKNSKLLNRAINKKMAFSEAGQRKATGNSGGSYSSVPRATTYQTPTVNNAFSESKGKTTTTTQDVKTDNVKTNAATDTLKSDNDTKKTDTTQSSSNIKKDMLNSPINSNTTKKTNTSKQGSTQKSSLVNGIATSAKAAISGKSNSASTTNTITKDILNTVESKAQDIAKDVKGTLSSSVKSFNNEKIKPLVKMTSSIVDSDKPNRFIPPIAGVTAAAVAGMGTKVYVDKGTPTKKKEDEPIKFFNNLDEDDDEKDKKEEQENKNEALSKEDLITILENKS